MTTIDTLVRLLADRSPTPPSFLPLPSAWSEERRFLTSTADGKRTVSREGFPTLAAAVGDMEKGVGL